MTREIKDIIHRMNSIKLGYNKTHKLYKKINK